MQKLNQITKAINMAIASDSEAKSALSNLSIMVVAFKVIDFNKTIYLQFMQTEVIAYSEFNEEIDLTIKGRFMALVGMSPIAKNSVPNAWPKSIEIQGNIEKATALRHWMANIQIDWVELLSPVMGDTFANVIVTGLNKVSKLAEDIKSSVSGHVKDWINNESSSCITLDEMTYFLDDVDTVKQQVDRLAARIELLEQERQ